MLAEQMAENHQTTDRAQDANNKASEVIAEALSSMRDDEEAHPIASAIEGAWSPTKFDLDAALKAIDAEPDGRK